MSELALKLIKEAKEKRLTRLDLGNCGLTELPDELFELVWLEELILSTQWSIHSLKTSRVSVVNTKNNDKPNTIKKLDPKIKQLCILK